ncbi:hypothetical protein Pyn_16044 [Prunus yedoensis var. nudiflora]|uniref:Uncharacterized protein n=1 Tax=Prunus yedoensis var. nudiflora TaxID=2094558 RepID=A0A314UGG9_PRUYE|nr:hypothetical protein Pyn_16044 [Prunus yedoensis var. nudiflora]
MKVEEWKRKKGRNGRTELEIEGFQRLKVMLALSGCVYGRERKKMEAWVALADFQQLDEKLRQALGWLDRREKGKQWKNRA